MYLYFTDLDFRWTMQGGLKNNVVDSSCQKSICARRDSVRIESSRKVPHTNRVKFVATFYERGRFMYHYFTDLDFQERGSTPRESSRIVKCLRRIDSVWMYWIRMEPYYEFVSRGWSLEFGQLRLLQN